MMSTLERTCSQLYWTSKYAGQLLTRPSVEVQDEPFTMVIVWGTKESPGGVLQERNARANAGRLQDGCTKVAPPT